MPIRILGAKTRVLHRNSIHAITCQIHAKYMIVHTSTYQINTNAGLDQHTDVFVPMIPIDMYYGMYWYVLNK